jgi:activator of HSP90 ATPase
MRNVVQQSVVLPASAESLFDMYLDPAVHAAITGHPVTIGAQPGAAFRAFGGQLSGAVLAVARPHLVVQSWRSTKFHADDPDSTLILTFTRDGSNATSGRIDLVHFDVPDHDLKDVTEGWSKYYWTPWKTYLSHQRTSEDK